MLADQPDLTIKELRRVLAERGLRTIACGAVRTARHSIAVATPIRRVRRCQIPMNIAARFWPSGPPGRPRIFTPYARLEY